MQPQFDNRVMSSFLLFVDNKIQKFGSAFKNYSGLFYPITSNVQNTYTYAAPFKQLCNDTGVTGAIVMTGVYLNGNFVTIGQSGLRAINHYDGTLLFNNPVPSGTVISGNYAIKEIGVGITDLPDWNLLFETDYVSNNAYNQTLSGLPTNTKISPYLFIKYKTQENVPFGFQGVDNNTIQFRAVLVCDTQFQKVAVCNILKNYNLYHLPITTNIPLDSLGNYTGAPYAYDVLPPDTNYTTWIMKVRASDVLQAGKYALVVKNMALIDFELQTIIKNPQ